ncbi:hypothetical protein ACQKD8_20175, partial [Pseudomonas sp. NPDC077405]
MHIHLLSDLHLEVSSYVPAATDADVVVLAGDIHTKARGVRWALDSFSGTVLYGNRPPNPSPRFFQIAAWCAPIFGGHHFKPLSG